MAIAAGAGVTAMAEPLLDRRAFWAGLCALLAAPAAASTYAAAPRLRRGVNLHHLLSWPETTGEGASLDYVWPPFRRAENAISDDELARLAAMGFDYLRVTVDPGIFLAAKEPRFKELTELTVAMARRLIGAGFSVILDLHPTEVNPAYGPKKVVDGVDGPVFLAYARIVEKLARAFDALPHDRFLFEMMNEPWLYTPRDMEQWQRMMTLLHAKARAAAPELPLVVTGAKWSDAKALMQLDLAPFRDSNVFYTFHYYDPHTWTHQGVESDAETRHLSGLRWPPERGNIDAVTKAAVVHAEEATASSGFTAAAREKRAARDVLTDYFRTGHDPARVVDDFAAVAQWAKSNRLSSDRIFLGEFGCVKTALGQTLPDRLPWFSAVREAAEANGFPWALWVYKGYGGMAVVSDEEVDWPLVDAIGLRHP